MAALDLGEVAGFPFIDPPDTRNVTDGVRLLEELGAVRPTTGARQRYRGSTETGQQARPAAGRPAPRPDDPRGRPERLRPRGADHRRRAVDPGSAGSGRPTPGRPPTPGTPGSPSRARTSCRWSTSGTTCANSSASCPARPSAGCAAREYLHYLRVREWQDVHGQLRQAASGPRRHASAPTADAGRAQAAPAPGRGARRPIGARRAARRRSRRRAGAAVRSRPRRPRAPVAAGRPALAHRDAGASPRRRPQRRRRGPAEFTGARGSRFAIFPDSELARKPPQWVVAAELVETSRLWARVVARIEPEWVEPLAGHLVKRGYSEPHWDARRGAAMALERVTLYGLPLVAARPVTLSRIDPVLARELFITHALVEGDWQTHHKFFHRNRQLLAEAEELEQRARRRGIVADDAALFAFYDRRIPADVTSARHFDSWWKKARHAEPDLLTMTPGRPGWARPPTRSAPEDYPTSWGELPLSYEFAPGEPDDGVAGRHPAGRAQPGQRRRVLLARARPARGTRHRADQVAAEAAADYVRARRPTWPGTCSPGSIPRRGDLHRPLSARAGQDRRRQRPRRRLRPRQAAAAPAADVPGHRRRPGAGRPARTSAQLRRRAAAHAARAAGRRGGRPDQDRADARWDFDSLPREFAAGQVRAYPALRDAGDSVEHRAVRDAGAGGRVRCGSATAGCCSSQVPSGARAVASRLPTSAKLAHEPPSVPRAPASWSTTARRPPPTRSSPRPAARPGTPTRSPGCSTRPGCRCGSRPPTWSASSRACSARRTRSKSRLDQLTNPAMARVGRRHAGAARRADLPRVHLRDRGAAAARPGRAYLRGMAHRMEKAPRDLRRDLERMDIVHRVTDDYEQVLGELGPDAPVPATTSRRSAG